MPAKYARDLDRSLPLTKRWGGQLLSLEEVQAVQPETEAIEYLGMNLEHLIHEACECDAATPMTPEQLGALFELAFMLEGAADEYKRIAKVIQEVAPQLWRFRDDPAEVSACV